MILRRKKQLTQRERTLISDADLKTSQGRLIYYSIVIALSAGALTTFIPFLWGVLSALKEPAEVFAFPPRFFPHPTLKPWKWQWDNYVLAWNSLNFPYYFFNTILLAIGVWFFQIFPSALAGYAISKLRMGILRIFTYLFFITLMVPFFVIFIPLYLTVTNLPIFHINLTSENLMGGMLAVILPAGVNAFNIFVFKSFFDEIPDDLLEAARVDGASEWRIFLTIMLPLSQSILAVLSIFSIIATWNDFFWPFMVLAEKRYTIMVKLYWFSQEGSVPWNITLAALMLAAIPAIIFFLIFQKKIMQGITLTGLKI